MPSSARLYQNGNSKKSYDQTPIAVLGMGHVGLPTALGLAELGWNVIGADSDNARIEALKSGDCPFFEPGLSELLQKHSDRHNLAFTGDVEEAIRKCTILFICVGTPQGPGGEPDLTDIEALARTIARNLNGYKLIVEKSTVPALTGRWFHKTVQRHAGLLMWENGNADMGENRLRLGRLSFDVASNPEFLQEGKALEKFFHPDRVVCGVSSEKARKMLADLYEPLGCPILFTDLNTAELIKYTANAFLATKISFINMVADICEAVGADVVQVANGIGLDSRIGNSFLNAGLGFGGYCLPKDLKAFIHLAEEQHVDASLLRQAEMINQRRAQQLLKKVREALWVLKGKTLAILGLSFKPGTDDIREAPSLKIVEALMNEGAILRLYDPEAMPNVKRLYPEQPGRKYCSSAYEAAEGAHALLFLTEWDEFRQLDLKQLRQRAKLPIIIDGRNMFSMESLRRAGFEYICMGRPATLASPTPLWRPALAVQAGKSRSTTAEPATGHVFAARSSPGRPMLDNTAGIAVRKAKA
jgi:UDPglucose 6-dehydrogenase